MIDEVTDPWCPELRLQFIRFIYALNLFNFILSDNPDSLTNTMWFVLTMHMGLRGRDEHTQMLWGDLQLMTASDGREYVQFSERKTKTRTGAFPPKMFQSPVPSKSIKY